MEKKSVTLTIPEGMYSQTQRLIEEGLFRDLEDVVMAGIRYVLLEAAMIETELEPLRLAGPERYMFYLTKLRREIAEAGGLFPGKTKEEVINILGSTREQIYEEKYAAHFRRQ